WRWSFSRQSSSCEARCSKSVRKLSVMRVIRASMSPSLLPKQYWTMATFALARSAISLTDTFPPPRSVSSSWVACSSRSRVASAGAGPRGGGSGGAAGAGARLWSAAVDTGSHPEDRLAPFGQRGVSAHAERESEHVARVRGVDHAVVPQPGARVVGVALCLVLGADLALARLDRV